MKTDLEINLQIDYDLLESLRCLCGLKKQPGARPPQSANAAKSQPTKDAGRERQPKKKGNYILDSRVLRGTTMKRRGEE